MSQCTPKGGNTNSYGCDISAQRIDGFLCVPSETSIPKNTADPLKYITDKLKLDSKELRWYSLMGIEQAANNSEEAQIGTFGYGRQVKQRNGNAIYRFDLLFSKCLAEAVIPFDEWDGGIFLVTSEQKLMGADSVDKKSFVAYSPKQFSVVAADIISLGTTDLQVIGISVDFGDRLNFAMDSKFMSIAGLTAKNLKGITDVDLIDDTTAPAGYVDVRVQTKCGETNLFDNYKDKLSEAAVWNLVNSSDGTTVTPTGIAPQEATKTFRITAPAGTYNVSLQPVSVLDENGIIGFESDMITVTTITTP